MNRVIVQLDNVVKYFNGVTKVQCFLACNSMDNEIKIYQGDTVTTFKEDDILGLEVVS